MIKTPRFEIKNEGSFESSQEGLDAIHDVSLRARELIENEYSKGINSWSACVRTFLGRIMSEAQFLNTRVVTQEYKNRVEKEGAEILAELRQLESVDERREMPTEEIQKRIYNHIFNLAPSQTELI